MKKAEKILMLHLNKNRRGAPGKPTLDSSYFRLWKKCYPTTFKHIIAAMEDYKNGIVPDFGRNPKKKY